MRLRRVSEELENDYNKRRKISGIGTTFFLAITAVIIILIVIERKSWKEAVIEMKLSGKAEAVNLMRTALSDLMAIRGVSI